VKKVQPKFAIPGMPPRQRLLGKRHVLFVIAVLHSHDLADIRRSSERVWDRARIDERHAMAAPGKFQRRRRPVNACPNNRDLPHAHTGPQYQ
jgi:hypothetical protein